MIDKLTITISGLDAAKHFFEVAPDLATEAARISINDVATGAGLTLVRREIEKEVAFPAGYLNDPSKIGVTQLASNSNLQATISARARATSLARFAMTAPFPTPKKGGVTVTVTPGNPKTIPGFLVRLKRGASLTEDNYNLGLAIRLKPGQQLINRNSAPTVFLDSNIVLLYGPSVDQVFRDVAVEQSPAIAGLVGNEFYRQFARLAGD